MKNASEESADILARLQLAHDSATDKPSFATDNGPASHEKLKQGGYPARHIKSLSSGIFGASAEKASELWPKVEGGDCMLLLVGTRGAGKTLMACEWAKRRIESGHGAGRYVKCADIIAEIKSTWHDGGRSIGTEQDVLRKYRTTKYLVIDEFHERGASDWEARTLINILDHRYDSMLATILIANLSEAEANKTLNPSLIDRANETGGIVVCDWPSYRA